MVCGQFERETNMADKKSGMEIQSVEVWVKEKAGSPLVVHNFSEKAKQQIRDKQQKKAKKASEQRNPKEEFLANRYVDAKGRECVPVAAVKKAIICAATAFSKDLKKVALRQAIFVDSLESPGSMLAPLHLADGSPAVGAMREDAVTIGINIRGLAYRPEYPTWKIGLRIEFNNRLVSLEQLLALIDQAGWGVGICEGRPERSSALGWGRFERVVNG